MALSNAIFAVFIYFTYLSCLGHASDSSQRPEDRAALNLLAQVPEPGDIHELHGEPFCACYLQTLKSASRKKVGRFGSLDAFP